MFSSRSARPLYKEHSVYEPNPQPSHNTGRRRKESSPPPITRFGSKWEVTDSSSCAGRKRALIEVDSDSELKSDIENYDHDHMTGNPKRRREGDNAHSSEKFDVTVDDVVDTKPKDQYNHCVASTKKFIAVQQDFSSAGYWSDEELKDVKHGISTMAEHSDTDSSDDVVDEQQKQEEDDDGDFITSVPVPGKDAQSLEAGVSASVLGEDDDLDRAESDGEKIKVKSTWSNMEMRRKYPKLCLQIRMLLRKAEQEVITAEEFKKGLDVTRILEAKYKKLLNPKPKKKIVRKPYPKTAREVEELLHSREEVENPWGVLPTSEAPGNGMLFRTWDKSSQCQILDADFGLLSGGANSNFKTKEGRKQDLENHASWGNRKITPFISTTPSVSDIQKIWIFGFRKRQKPPISTIRVTLINSKARLAAGWPILKMADQLEYYKFKIPERCSLATFMNEYLLPFRVRREEIVWTWHWKDIQQWMGERNTDDIEVWGRMVATPMFMEHERLRLAGEGSDERELKLLELLQKLMPQGVRTNWTAAIRASLLG